MRLLSTNSSYQRKKIGWMESRVTDELRYLPFPLRVCVFSWFPWPVCHSSSASLSDSSCCSESEDSEIRICEFIPATACVLSRFFFFLYSESISGPDALHTVHNSGFVHTLPKEQASSVQQILFLRGHDPYTLACKARPSFDGCRTYLSVSLSLSLSSSSLMSTLVNTRSLLVASCVADLPAQGKTTIWCAGLQAACRLAAAGN